MIDGAATPGRSSGRRFGPETEGQRMSSARPTPEPPADDDRQATVISSVARREPTDAEMTHGLLGRTLGHFEIQSAVGVGGMAAVLKAYDKELGRVVALKILPPDLATDPENVLRFKQEARAAARLDHENVARVYFCGEDQGRHFIAFEFVEGENLRDRMAEAGGRVPLEEAIGLMLDVTAGLAHAAQRGVVHRDVKPSNILVTPDGRAKIVDMGLARNIDRSTDGGVTQSGITLGTFDYISPEQAIDPRQADARSDIYSLGCTFYHALTGVPPVPDGTPAKKLHWHRDVAPTDPRELLPSIPDDVAAILARMMAKDPAHRYQSPADLADHLRQVAARLNLSAPGPETPLGRAHAPAAILPEPPRSATPWLIGLAVVAGFAAVLAVRGRGPARLDLAPDWIAPEAQAAARPRPEEPPPSQPAEVPSIASAEDAAALLRLLQDPKLQTITLTGRLYDLSNWTTAQKRLLTHRKGLTLQGAVPASPAVIQAAATSAAASAGSEPARATFRNLSWIMRPASSDGLTAAWHWPAALVPLFENCSFSSPRASAAPLFGLAGSEASRWEFRQCYFPPGGPALALAGPVRCQFRDCVFCPAAPTIRVGPASAAGLRLDRCSVLLGSESLIRFEGDPRARVAAEGCLFAVRDEGELPSPPALLCGGDVPARSLIFGPPDEEEVEGAPPRPNIYDRVVPLKLANELLSFADCQRQGLAVADAARRTPPPVFASPVGDPEGLEPVRLAQALALDPRRPDLRVDAAGREFAGSRYLLDRRIYPQQIASAAPPANPSPSAWVWDPTLPADKPSAGQFRSLPALLVAAEESREVLVRSNDLLQLPALDLDRGDKPIRITLRPDRGCRPSLSFMDKATRNALFTLGGSELVLEDLEIRLAPVTGQTAGATRLLAAMGGGGKLTLRRCAVTLAGEQPSQVALAGWSEAADAMMMLPADRPAAGSLVLEDCAVRGRGVLAHFDAVRDGEVSLRNCLVALDGGLLRVQTPEKTKGARALARVAAEQSTLVLTEPLVEVRPAGPVDLKVPPQRVALDLMRCVVCPGPKLKTPPPMASLPGDGWETFRDSGVLAVQASRNRYGWPPSAGWLRFTPADPSSDDEPPSVAGSQWLAWTREEADAASEVQFSVVPENERIYRTVQKGDFAVAAISPPLAVGESVGYRPEKLPAFR
jgi:serine/threonine protein kinase